MYENSSVFFVERGGRDKNTNCKDTNRNYIYAAIQTYSVLRFGVMHYAL